MRRKEGGTGGARLIENRGMDVHAHHPIPSPPLPLHEPVRSPPSPLVTHQKLVKLSFLACLCTFLLYLLLYRLHTTLQSGSNIFVWVALLCEIWLCFHLLLCLCARLSFVERQTYPARLLEKIKMEKEQGRGIPAVDVFVTTADPEVEPPMVTVNTVLSVLALDYYPAQEKIGCYVGDDGGSLLTLWALKQAVPFARKWVPFCRNFDPPPPRAPSPFFARNPPSIPDSHNFVEQWTSLKASYEELQEKVQSMTKSYSDRESRQETIKMLLQVLKAECEQEDDAIAKQKQKFYESRALNGSIRDSHEGYCEVLIDKGEEGMPCLVYITREKAPEIRHHYKAGNMNALIRVSGIFTNAPFFLNLDCDMYVNDAKALLHAMCFFMDPCMNSHLAFVQFPQLFEVMVKDETFRNYVVNALEVIFKGFDGAQGPVYAGTGCMHKREAIYGKTLSSTFVHYLDARSLGNSATFVTCAKGLSTSRNVHNLTMRGFHFIQEAMELIGCRYEEGTQWGKEVGLVYESIAEDVSSSLRIHGQGWKSVFCSPRLPTFLGRCPSNHDILLTKKRWATGFLEILVGINSPFSIRKLPKLSIIQRVLYIYLSHRIIARILAAIYTVLPCAVLLSNGHLFPKIEENGMWVLLAFGVLTTGYWSFYVENMLMGATVMDWWSALTMGAICATSSDIFAMYEVLKKVMGIADTKFNITPKVDVKHESVVVGLAINSESVLLIPPTVIVLLNVAGFLSALVSASWNLGTMLGKVESYFCLWVLFVLQLFVKGLVLWIMGSKRSDSLSSFVAIRAVVIATLIFFFIRITS